VTCTGWGWDYVEDHVTGDRLAAFGRYWRQNPPLHMLVQGLSAYFGVWKPEPDAAPTGRGSLDELRAMFPGGMIGG
jgi:hypothetical protein